MEGTMRGTPIRVTTPIVAALDWNYGSTQKQRGNSLVAAAIQNCPLIQY
jgi:hypothetical protein